ncbi:acyltransferase [Homoserinibacter sp. GY 40078]|nr:acyltransferase [Homoserinibacter sp. GY 40078]
MLVTTAGASSPERDAALAGRDLTLDLARVFCVLLVVAVHLMFVGVGATPDGGIEIRRPLEEQPWFWLATWFGQVMPLFFVVGGFATATALRSARRRIPDADLAARTFAHGRLDRLARPALPLLAFLAVALGVAAVVGVDPALVGAVAIGVGSPLWFLGAYLICQLAAPLLLRAHEIAPWVTAGSLLVASTAVDVLQFSLPGVPEDTSGMSVLGYLNLLFVWPLVQLIGFHYADGAFARRRPWQLVLLAAGSWAVLVPLTAWGPYSLDMLTNLNPPTVPLIALGVGQAALLQLLKRPLSALMRARPVRGAVYALGSRLITLYLWHLPVIVAIAGAGLLVPALTPVAGSSEWWLTRPLVYLAVLGVVFLISLGVARLERPVPVARPASFATLAIAGVTTIAPIVVITVRGLTLWSAVAAALGYAVAVIALRAGQKPKSPKSAEPKSAEPKSAEPKSADASAVDASAAASSPDAA